MHIAGSTAIVTGAGGALGSSMVGMLLAAGAKTVVALDKNEAALSGLPAKNVVALACDLADAAATEKTLAGVFSEHTVDTLVNNAGILHSAPLVNMLNKDASRFAVAAADWQRVLGANLSSVFYVTQLVADHMAKKRVKGVIVNMSSVCAAGNAGQSAYSASKAGVVALTRVWAKELGPLGIRSVAIAPGYIDTPSTHRAVAETQLAAIRDHVPLKTLGQPEHILSALRFAIENDYVNGTVLEIDGGLSV